MGQPATPHRVLGQRAQRTQKRILEGLRTLLERTKLSDIPVSELARESGTSPATFYRYFPDVEHAALMLAASLADDLADAVAKAELPWDGEDGYVNAEAFVTAFLAHWTRNAPVLRMRNHLADEGDPRFRRVRLQTLRKLTPALAAKISSHKAAGTVAEELDSDAAVNMLVGMLERVGAFQTRYPGGRRTAVTTATLIIRGAVCGNL